MTALFRPTIVAQPPALLPIDWDNPICRGLRFSAYNSAQDWAPGPMNYVTQQGPSVPNVAVSPFDSALGRAPAFVAGSSSKAQTSIPVNINGCVQFTIAFWLWWDTYSTNNAACLAYEPGDGVSAVGGMFRINPNDGGGNFAMRLFSSSSNNQFATISRPSAAAWHHYVFFCDMAQGTNPVVGVNVDGVGRSLSGSSTYGSGSIFALADLPLTFMIRPAGNPGSGKIANVNIWSRMLQGVEAISIYRNSWQVLRADIVSVGRPTTASVIATNRWFLGA